MTASMEKPPLERIDTTGSEPGEIQDALEKAPTDQTLAAVDLDNRHAYKGDDSDGKVEWTPRGISASIFLGMLYTGSQLPLYFVGASLTFIADDLRAPGAVGWMPVANTLAIAAVVPFCGYLQDLFGKRYFGLFGAALLCVGCVVLGTAQNLAAAVAGMALTGAGAGVGELTGLAGLAEIVPVKHRGYSMAALTSFVLPFTPYVMYTEMFSTRGDATWRWGPWICLMYNGITLAGLTLTYFPHAHLRTENLPVMTVLKRIDYVGGVLSLIGLTLLLVGLQAPTVGTSHPWSSAYTLSLFFVGFFTLVAWVMWEWKFSRHPMIEKELFRGQRVVALAYGIAFIGGMMFFSIINFWPLAISTVWSRDPVAIGWRALPVVLSTVVGAVMSNSLISIWPGGMRWLMFVGSMLVTAFGGSLASMTPDNQYQSVVLAAICAFGLGGIIIPSATVAIMACPDAVITTCAAMSVAVRAVGGAIGYSIYYSVFSKHLNKRLPELVAQYAIEAGLPLTSVEAFIGTFLSTPEQAMEIPGVTPAIMGRATYGSQWAYAESMKYVWLTSIAFGVCAMVCALFIPNTKKFATNRVAVML